MISPAKKVNLNPTNLDDKSAAILSVLSTKAAAGVNINHPVKLLTL